MVDTTVPVYNPRLRLVVDKGFFFVYLHYLLTGYLNEGNLFQPVSASSLLQTDEYSAFAVQPFSDDQVNDLHQLVFDSPYWPSFFYYVGDDQVGYHTVDVSQPESSPFYTYLFSRFSFFNQVLDYSLGAPPSQSVLWSNSVELPNVFQPTSVNLRYRFTLEGQLPVVFGWQIELEDFFPERSFSYASSSPLFHMVTHFWHCRLYGGIIYRYLRQEYDNQGQPVGAPVAVYSCGDIPFFDAAMPWACPYLQSPLVPSYPDAFLLLSADYGTFAIDVSNVSEIQLDIVLFPIYLPFIPLFFPLVLDMAQFNDVEKAQIMALVAKATQCCDFYLLHTKDAQYQISELSTLVQVFQDAFADIANSVDNFQEAVTYCITAFYFLCNSMMCAYDILIFLIKLL